MRRLPNWLIVAAVIAVVALAAADAIRPTGDSPSNSGAPPRTAPLRGLLVVAGPGCSPVALRFPTLAEEQPPLAPDCGGTVWSADGTVTAACAGGRTSIVPTDFSARLLVRGCAPAWRPDGAVSVLRNGDLVVARRYGRPQVFLSKAALAEKVEREIGGSYELTEVAWIDPETFAGIVRGTRPWQQAVVVATADSIEWIVRQFGQRISSVRASPDGEVAFARNRLGREFVMLGRDGREIPLPRIANVRAIAWSPDETWVALATRTSTFVARTGTREVVARVPLGGDALDWLP